MLSVLEILNDLLVSEQNKKIKNKFCSTNSRTYFFNFSDLIFNNCWGDSSQKETKKKRTAQ